MIKNIIVAALMIGLILCAAFAPNVEAKGIEITPEVLVMYLKSQKQECTGKTNVLALGPIGYRGKSGHAWEVHCSNQNYVVAVENDAQQTAWWAKKELVEKYLAKQ